MGVTCHKCSSDAASYTTTRRSSNGVSKEHLCEGCLPGDKDTRVMTGTVRMGLRSKVGEVGLALRYLAGM
jgi:hypothetical protein